MGVYEKHLLPCITHLMMNNRAIAAERRRALEGVEGEVLELGIGSGLNLAHYGKNVRRVVGVDPSAGSARLAEKAIASVPFPVEIRTDPAEALAIEGEFDVVVSTFTLCTIPDVMTALLQAKRALKPEGRFYFLEHGLSPDPKVQKWQRRMEPIQRAVAGGCHLTRDAQALLEEAGFAIERIESYYMTGLKLWTFLSRGVAKIRAT